MSTAEIECNRPKALRGRLRAQRARLVAALIMVAAALAAAASSGAAEVTGTVFWDGDGDGVRDPAEQPVAGVRVNANHRAATTGTDGTYRLESPEPLIAVSLSFPTGTWPTAGWFSLVDPDTPQGVDFGLRPDEQELPFLFVQFTDPHGRQDLALRKIAEECAGLPLDVRFVVCTGDMAGWPRGEPTVRRPDNVESRFRQIGAMRRVARAPLFAVPGNHDTVDFRWGGEPVTPEDTAHRLFADRAWERYVCPSHWSFSYAGVHFVGIEYAQFVDGAWDTLSPATRRWLSEDLAAAPGGERTVLCAHNPAVGRFAVDNDLTLCLVGDSHTEGVYCRPGGETPEYPDSVLVGGLAMASRAGEERRWCQDGRPAGYRMVVVGEDGIESFYKAFDEPHTIMVNEPRRFASLDAADTVTVRGQVFDPEGLVSGADVTLLRAPDRAAPMRAATLRPKRLWADFEATLDTGHLPEGFYDLRVSVRDRTGTRYGLQETYLLLTGVPQTFAPAGPAVLTGRIDSLPAEGSIVVNGQSLGLPAPVALGREFSMPVPSELLRGLNRVSLDAGGGRAVLSGIRLRYQDTSYIDQHRVFAWWYDPVLRGDNRLYFDLGRRGVASPWGITEQASGSAAP